MRANVGLRQAEKKDLFKGRERLFENNLVFIRGEKTFDCMYTICGQESHLWYVPFYINRQFYVLSKTGGEYRIWVKLREATKFDVLENGFGNPIKNVIFFVRVGSETADGPWRITPSITEAYLQSAMQANNLYVLDERQDFAVAPREIEKSKMI